MPSEWMGVRVHHCDDTKKLVFGTLDNEPLNDYDGKVELGSELAVAYSQIRETRSQRSSRNNRPMLKLTNVVVRDVRDRDGHKLGRLIEPHDGTESGVIAAAQRISDRMFAEYSDSSNIESRLCATDASGKPKWAVTKLPSHCRSRDGRSVLYLG